MMAAATTRAIMTPSCTSPRLATTPPRTAAVSPGMTKPTNKASSANTRQKTAMYATSGLTFRRLSMKPDMAAGQAWHAGMAIQCRSWGRTAMRTAAASAWDAAPGEWLVRDVKVQPGSIAGQGSYEYAPAWLKESCKSAIPVISEDGFGGVSMAATSYRPAHSSVGRCTWWRGQEERMAAAPARRRALGLVLVPEDCAGVPPQPPLSGLLRLLRLLQQPRPPRPLPPSSFPRQPALLPLCVQRPPGLQPPPAPPRLSSPPRPG